MYESLESTIDALRSRGVTVEDPWDVVAAFESQVAEYAGSAYAVAVDSCTNALFLCLKYLRATGPITLPARTYLSVPQAAIHSGCLLRFEDFAWSGCYALHPLPVIDSAARFTRGMYRPGSFHCLSFHRKKILPIAKGGMILTDSRAAADWFRLASYEGRDRRVPHDQMAEPTICGWNMYMPPEQAARGISLLTRVNAHNPDCGGSWKYRDISGYGLWRCPNGESR